MRTIKINKSKLTIKLQNGKKEIHIAGDKINQDSFSFTEDIDVKSELSFFPISNGYKASLKLELKNESCGENNNLETESPIKIELDLAEKPQKITAMYLFNDWWTRPAFARDFNNIPSKTQIAFLQYSDRYVCLVPAVGQKFKAWIEPGKDDHLTIAMSAYRGSISRLEEDVFVWIEADNIYTAINKAFIWLANQHNILSRNDRQLPKMLHYLGWCSWDAFYKDVNEEKIRSKLQELEEKNIPIRWALIDDGWLSTNEELLCDYVPNNQKFSNAFGKLTSDIKQRGYIKWFGVWHALGGYWGGIHPESILAEKAKEYLLETANDKLVPYPKSELAFGFYRDWYRYLSKEGIDFVKVDGQSATRNYFENTAPIADASREIHQGLEAGASFMNGAIINCMGMAMENILARPTSAVSRNSDDFVPDKIEGFAEHLLQNAYNALYHDELYICDWDMFWTEHRDCIKHSFLRGISGGPIYISDKIGMTNPDVLKPLAYLNGEILMMDRAAKPTLDCVFEDISHEGVLKLNNIGTFGNAEVAGGVAVFNLTAQEQTYTYSATDIWGLEDAKNYWVYNYFKAQAQIVKKEDIIHDSLDSGDYAWYQFLPYKGKGTVLGLTDKYNGFLAIEDQFYENDRLHAVVRESGNISFITNQTPRNVICNGLDLTSKVYCKGDVYTIPLREETRKVSIDIIW